MHCLLLKPDTDSSAFEPLVIKTPRVVLIGRSTRCQLQLPQNLQSVSRVHAELTYHLDEWLVADRSTTGTFVNDERIATSSPVPLHAGDRLRIGPCTILVDITAPQETDLSELKDTEVTVSEFDPAHLDPVKVLKFTIELPQRLGEVATEEEIYAVCCDYFVSALAPAMVSTHVLLVGNDGDVEVLAEHHRDFAAFDSSAAARPPFSRRMIERATTAPDAVVFLHRQQPDTTMGVTADASTHSLGACFIQHSAKGQPVMLYVLSDQALGTGERWVAEYLHLVAMLTKQHVLSLRRAALSKYFSPRVVEMLLQHGVETKPASLPQVMQATAVFLDLRGFSLSVEARAADLLRLHSDLVDVMTIVTDAVFAAGGTIIDYQGDGVFAAWGVPFEQEDQQVLAIRGILAIFDRLRHSDLGVFQSFASGHGAPFGAGVACGQVLAGTVGSASMFKYGLLGPTVNLASRLEGLTKPNRFSAPILVERSVQEALKETEVQTRRVGRVRAAGMQAVCDVFEVVVPNTPEEQLWTPESTVLWDSALEALEVVCSFSDIDDLASTLDALPPDHPRTVWIQAKAAELRTPGAIDLWDGINRWEKD